MQRHKIVARIIFLIFSFINFALAAPVSLVRGIHEARVDMDVAGEDMTTSWKRWNLPDMWSTNAADRMNTPSSPVLPAIDSNAIPHPSLSDNSHTWQPVPVDPESPSPPADHLNNLGDVANDTPESHLNPRMADSDNSHPLPVDPPPPAHNNRPLDIDLNEIPQPSPADSGNSHPLPDLQPDPPAHNGPPSDIGLNKISQPSPSDSGNSHPLPGLQPDPPAHNGPPSDIGLNENSHPSLSDSGNSHPLPDLQPDPPAHHNLAPYPTGIDLNNSPQRSSDSTGSSDYNSESVTSSHSMTASETQSEESLTPSEWYEMSVFEFPKSPSASSSHNSLDSDLANLPPNLGTAGEQPASVLLPSADTVGSSKRPLEYPSSDDQGPSKRPYDPSRPGPSTWADHPSDVGPSTRPDPPPSDVGPSTRPDPPPLDPGPSTLHTPSSSGSLQHEAENILSELSKVRFKRHISGSLFL